MPEHRPGPDEPVRAALAVIERIKREIASHPDPETLNQIRAAFRREIPLNLRSYAAALLILESSGAKTGRRSESRRDQRKADGGRSPDGRRGERSDKPPKDKQPKAESPRRPEGSRQAEGSTPEPRLDENRPRYSGEGVTVFFGMGKRQRLYPRVLYRILLEDGHLAPEEIGDIRSFDNYSFADVDPLCADTLIETVNNLAFRGRGLPVSKARKRGAEAEELAATSSPAVDRDEETETLADDGLDSDGDFADEDLGGDDFTDRDEGVDETFEEGEEPKAPAAD